MASVRRAVVAGANGFIGRLLVARLREAGYQVATIGRTSQADASWDEDLGPLVDGAALLVNLAGKNVGCRYHEAARNEILSSRVETTRVLHQAVSRAANPPQLWLNASTATIYRHSMDAPNTEEDGRIGEGFSVDVARSWEREFFSGDLPTRRVALRMAIVLGDGPATTKLLNVARWGLGGAQHDSWWPAHRRYRGIGTDPSGPERSTWYRSGGNQLFSWIHVEDVLGAIWHIIEHPQISGPVNLAAPNPVTNRALMASLRRVAGAKFGLPSYRWMLEPAMFVLRVEPEMLLKSRWALPAVLERTGYTFRYPDLDPALDDVAATLSPTRR
ncbi:epimerase [Glutamicibacter arilaitensis]|uniref:epimerase n=1 Tax=Glutamicibacter arilaitensis TaxID=256701 RepID=UPI000ECCDBAA|nr:NAD-dependent epimerase [Glutamicibacter sp.]